MSNDKIVTPSFYYILAANFLLFFAFYLILSVLPFYLKEGFMIGKSMIGFILSCYMLTALYICPLAGYLLDTFARCPLYPVAYFIFTAIFGGYMVTTALALSIALHVVHGFTFGVVTVAGDTILIDILSSSRRGESVGYYGLANSIAMSFGPMIGLFMQGNFTYDMIFSCSLLSGSLGFVMAYVVRTPYKQPIRREPTSLDRFFSVKGTWAGVSLLLLSIPYSMTATYVTMYAAETKVSVNSGLYLTSVAVGLAISRLFSGRQVDERRITLVISLEMYLAAATFFLFAALKELMHWNPILSSYLYIDMTLLQGVAFRIMFPVFGTPFVSLTPNNQRGTTTSTYPTSRDVDIGIGLTVGGSIVRELGGFNYAYLSGAYLMVLSTFFFLFKAGPHSDRYKLR